jgi:pyruvate dehydrogenase E2 component (dihydrolipoamide acetyltransferase)
MANAIVMPQVGQDIETAVLVEWRVQIGDRVKIGDIVALVESDKATFEVEAFEDGTVLELLLEPGQEGRVLEPIAFTGEPDETIAPEIDPRLDDKTNGKDPEKAKTPEPSEAQHVVQREKIFSTPSARRVAQEHGIEVASITGSGPCQRILKRDVLAAVQARTLTQTAGTSVQARTLQSAPSKNDLAFSKMRSRIARQMQKSKQTIPHFYLFMDVDMTAVQVWRKAFNEKAGVKVTVTDVLIKACGHGLRLYPRLNAHVNAEGVRLFDHINIGIAVGLDDGLLVPVIENVSEKNLETISRFVKDLANSAKLGLIKPSAPATFTLSNLGMLQVASFIPVINPPECAILGAGAVEKRLVPQDDRSFTVREFMSLTLACDHRAVDGTYAARFLASVKQFLEDF